MLYRFPPALSEAKDPSFLTGKTETFAKLKIESRAGSRTVLSTEHILIFVLRGIKLLHFPGETVTVTPGEVFLVRKGIYVMAEYIKDGLDFEALMLFLPGKLLRTMLEGVGGIPGAGRGAGSERGREAGGLQRTGEPAGEQAAKIYGEERCLVFSSTPMLDHFKEGLRRYFDNPPSQLESLLPLKQQEILHLLLSGPQGEQVRTFIRSAIRTDPADIDFVMKNYLLQPVTIEELAALCNCSLAKFKRDFQQRYGASPRQWINTQRLAHARMLLENSTKQVSEIALECGFENTSYFIRLFRQEYGLTPAAARAKEDSGPPDSTRAKITI